LLTPKTDIAFPVIRIFSRFNERVRPCLTVSIELKKETSKNSFSLLRLSSFLVLATSPKMGEGEMYLED